MNMLSSKLDLLPVDRRREKRSQTLKSGKMLCGGVSPTVIDCLIMEMSDGGARIETNAQIDVPEIFVLRTNDNIERRARRRWSIGDQIGIEFLSETGIVPVASSGARDLVSTEIATDQAKANGSLNVAEGIAGGKENIITSRILHVADTIRPHIDRRMSVLSVIFGGIVGGVALGIFSLAITVFFALAAPEKAQAVAKILGLVQ